MFTNGVVIILDEPLDGSPKFHVNFVSFIQPLTNPKLEVFVNNTLEVEQLTGGAEKSAIVFEIVFPPSTCASVDLQAFVTVNFIVNFGLGQLFVV